MVATSLRNTRRQAEHALTEGLEPVAGLLNEVFSALDDCVDRLERLEKSFGRVCSLVLIKARNLGLGCYSLSLDALAQRIRGNFKGLRNYLNTHASHLSVAPEVMAHLIDFQAGLLRPVQPYNEGVLRRNLSTLLAVLIWLAIEAVNCITVGEANVDDNLADKVEDLKCRSLILIDQPSGL